MRARQTKSFQNLSFRNDFNIKTSKTKWFFNKKLSKFHPARSCGFLGNPILFSTFLSKGLLRATLSRASNFFNNGCAPARAIIPVKKYHAGHIRFFFARARRNLQKPLGFLRILAPRIIKSHESHRRSSKNACTDFQKIYPRALSESRKKNNGFSTFMLHQLARATFARSFNGVRAPARGHNPCQIIPCGPHARGARPTRPAR